MTELDTIPFQRLKEKLGADALLAYTGERGAKGVIEPRRRLIEDGIPADFVKDYFDNYAAHDAVGILFGADPRIVERISASEYTLPHFLTGGKQVESTRMAIQKYVRDAGFEHLLLAGLESPLRGIAWIVAYRTKYRHPFSESDLDYARYHAPAVLHDALPDLSHMAANPSTSGSPLPLQLKEIHSAILEAKGHDLDGIMKFLRLTTGESIKKGPLRNRMTMIRRRLGTNGKRVTMQDLDAYSYRAPTDEGSREAKYAKRRTGEPNT